MYFRSFRKREDLLVAPAHWPRQPQVVRSPLQLSPNDIFAIASVSSSTSHICTAPQRPIAHAWPAADRRSSRAAVECDYRRNLATVHDASIRPTPVSEDALETLKLWIEAAESMTSLSRNVLQATLLLVAGLLMAFVARALVARFVRNIGRLLSARGSVGRLEETMSRHRVDVILGRGAFWIVVLLTLMTATQELGFPVVTRWIGPVVAYLPRILLGAVIVFLGVLAGALGSSALARALPASDIVDPQALGRLLHGAVVAFSVVLALQQLGIDVGFITTVVTIALLGFASAGALAFGFGGRTTVANILASHYVRELYEVGHTVRVQGLEGRIVRMTPTAVILSTPEGETAVPSQVFVEASSTRLDDGGRL
jgi:hypothetical protein